MTFELRKSVGHLQIMLVLQLLLQHLKFQQSAPSYQSISFIELIKRK